MLLFLKLYLSHLLADFLLQPNRIAKNKRRFGALLTHSGIHIVVAFAIVNVDLNVSIASAIAILAVSMPFATIGRHALQKMNGGHLLSINSHIFP